MKRIYVLILLALFSLSSCNSDDEDTTNPAESNYNLEFVCYEEMIELLQIELLDSNDSIVHTEDFYYVQAHEVVSYDFSNASKIRIKVNDEDYFHTFYEIRKNDELIYESVLNGFVFDYITLDL